MRIVGQIEPMPMRKRARLKSSGLRFGAEMLRIAGRIQTVIWPRARTSDLQQKRAVIVRQANLVSLFKCRDFAFIERRRELILVRVGAKKLKLRVETCQFL